MHVEFLEGSEMRGDTVSLVRLRSGPGVEVVSGQLERQGNSAVVIVPRRMSGSHWVTARASVLTHLATLSVQ